jgi:integrase
MSQHFGQFASQFSGPLRGGRPIRPVQKATNTLVRPYSEREITEFRSSAARRSTPARRRNALALLSLGAGAGLRPFELAKALVSDVDIEPSGLFVRIRGSRPRTVPVHARWEKSLLSAVQDRSGDEFIFTGYRYKGRATDLFERFAAEEPDELTPLGTRLHSTWVTGQLRAAVPIDIVIHLAGLSNPSSLDRYFHLLDQPNPPRIASFQNAITGRDLSQ